jgi:hypothetical protein
MTGSKQQILLVHGGSAYSKPADFLEVLKTRPLRDLPGEPVLVKWSSSFKEDLGDGYEVYMPAMPNAQNARYQEWKIWFERYVEHLHNGVILIGWSLGGSFLIKYLTELSFPVSIKALYVLAAPYTMTDMGVEDGADFNFDTELLVKVGDQTANVSFFHSKDDLVVPYEHALKYKAALPQAELVTFEDKNHFLIDSFPELLNNIKRR